MEKQEADVKRENYKYMRNHIKCKYSNKESKIFKMDKIKNPTKHCLQKRTLKYTESERLKVKRWKNHSIQTPTK